MDHRPTSLRWLALSVFAAVCVPLALTFASKGNETDAEETWTEQVILGQELYESYCAECHGVGEQGERRTAPALIGERHRLGDRGDAQRLYNYVSRTMPLDMPGELEDEEYWAILAYMLERNELLPREMELGPDNAEEVSLSQ